MSDIEKPSSDGESAPENAVSRRAAFLDAAMPGAWLDTRGRIQELNEAASELLEGAAKSLAGRPAISMIDPEDRHDIVNFLIDANASAQGTIQREVRLLAGYGPSQVVIGLAYFDGPTDPGFLLQIHDVTGLRVTEAALGESEARYRRFFEDHTVAMYRSRPSGEIIEANHAMANLTGYLHPRFLLSLDAGALYANPGDREVMGAEIERLGALAGRDFEMTRHDGSTVWVRDFSRALPQDDGSFIYEGAVFDVSEWYRAEAQLRRRALHQASVSALSQLALQSQDPGAVALSAVRRAQEVLNVDAVALLRGDPMKVSARWDRPELTGTLLDQLGSDWLMSQVPESQEATVVAAPSEGFVALLPVQDVNGTTALLAAANLTDPELTDDDIYFMQEIATVIAATMERSESRQRLEELISSKDEFIASISHEVRTPLTVVMGISHELQDRWKAIDDSERAELLGMMVDQTQDMSDLVEDLLVAARADIGKLPIHVEAMDVGPAIEAVVASVRTPPGVAITLSDRNPTCYADPARFRQIARNLLSNAFRYGGDEIRISISHSDDKVWLDFADNGEGVAVESRESIFEAYERAHRHTGLAGSVGLGLTVSRKLARLMDGDLTYRYDDGSVFTLELAAAPALMFWNAGSEDSSDA